MESAQPWAILQQEEDSQTVAPGITPLTANSLYLTPFNLPGFNGNTANAFLNYYHPKRGIVLVAQDGITFRWYYQIPMARKMEYKDDDTKFYINLATGQLFLCGTVDQLYTIHQFYVGSSPTVTYNNVTPTLSTSWVFPTQFAPILALKVAMHYRNVFKWDVISVAQADRISLEIQRILDAMTQWDADMNDSELEGVSYPPPGAEQTAGGFVSRVVGDSDNGPWG